MRPLNVQGAYFFVSQLNKSQEGFMKKLIISLLSCIPVLAFAVDADSFDVKRHTNSHEHHHKGCEPECHDRCPKGPTGPTGPTGPIGPTGPTGATGGNFTVPVTGDTLTATVVTPAIFTGAAGSFVTTYVATPDGRVLDGIPVLLTGLPTTLTFPVVTPATTGTYSYGLLISGATLVASAGNLPVLITSTATGITTTAFISVPALALTTPEAQFSADFVYNAPAFP